MILKIEGLKEKLIYKLYSSIGQYWYMMELSHITVACNQLDVKFLNLSDESKKAMFPYGCYNAKYKLYLSNDRLWLEFIYNDKNNKSYMFPILTDCGSFSAPHFMELEAIPYGVLSSIALIDVNGWKSNGNQWSSFRTMDSGFTVIYKDEFNVDIEDDSEKSDWIKSHDYFMSVQQNTPAMLVKQYQKQTGENGVVTKGAVLASAIVLGGFTTAKGFKKTGIEEEVAHDYASNLTDNIYQWVKDKNSHVKAKFNTTAKNKMAQKSAETIGKIKPLNAWAFAEGDSAILSKLKFVLKFGRMVLPMADFLTTAKTLNETEETTIFYDDNSLWTGRKINKQAYDDATKEYWEKQYEDAFGKPYDPTATDPYPDETTQEKEKEDQKKADEEATAKTNKEIAELNKKILQNQIDYMPKTNTITEELFQEANKVSNDGKKQHERKIQSYEDLHSQLDYSNEGITLKKGLNSNPSINHAKDYNNALLTDSQIKSRPKTILAIEEIKKMIPEDKIMKKFSDVNPEKRTDIEGKVNQIFMGGILE